MTIDNEKALRVGRAVLEALENIPLELGRCGKDYAQKLMDDGFGSAGIIISRLTDALKEPEREANSPARIRQKALEEAAEVARCWEGQLIHGEHIQWHANRVAADILALIDKEPML